MKVNNTSLLLDRRSIDLSGAREKEGHFHYKNFLRASKWGITCHTCSIIPKSLYCGLGLIPILSKGFWGWWSRYGMWYLFSKHSKSFYNESDLLFLVHHWCRLTSDLRGVCYDTIRSISTPWMTYYFFFCVFPHPYKQQDSSCSFRDMWKQTQFSFQFKQTTHFKLNNYVSRSIISSYFHIMLK